MLAPVKLIGAPSNQTINETDTVTFVCNISGNPAPVIKWYKDELTVGTGDTLSFPVFRNQSGYYWCSADNGLNVTVNASAYLNVHCEYKINSKEFLKWYKCKCKTFQGQSLNTNGLW